MSINPSVGGIEKLLGRLRMKSRYLAFKRFYRKTVGRITPLYRVLHRIKEHVKSLVFPAVSMFEDMGFYYIGPVDGHDVEHLETALRWARDLKIPVLVHVMTQKGRGYAPAEADPETYHGVGAFDPAVGVELKEKSDFSRTFGETMLELAEADPTVVAITAAMASGTGLTAFAARYPKRFFDVGIAEEHAAAMAAGFAKQGAKPVFAVYSTFLQRSYDMLIHDVALQRLHVVLGVDRAGLVGHDGETHHGTFDIAYLGSVPGMTVLCPSSFAELRTMLRHAVMEMDGPVAVRYPRGGEGDYRGDSGPAACVTMRRGTGLTLVSYGILINEALTAADLLAESGISAEVIKLNCVKPLDSAPILDSLKKTGRLLMVEDVCAAGCIGQNVLAEAAAGRVDLLASRLLNMGSGVVTHGGVQALYALKGVDARGIAAAGAELMRGGEGA
jgi:1-deoxy-D-xylulose-5-phosphate synthase